MSQPGQVMIVTMTREEMIAEWRLRRGLLPLSDNAEVVRADGLSVDTMIGLAIDDWYLHILDTADPSKIPVRDFSGEASVTVNADLSVDVAIPSGCRRVVGVRMEGWEREAVIADGADSPLARLQASGFGSGGCCRPVAVPSAGRLRLYRAPHAEAALVSLTGVPEPSDGIYEFDRSLLSTIGVEI